MKKLLSLSVAAFALAANPAFGAGVSLTWSASPSSANWIASGGDNNWGTANTYPGSITGTTNADTAIFTSSSTTAINSGSSLNIGNITFGASGNPALSSFTINSTAGSSLLLSSGGSISLIANTAATNITDTISAPIVLEGSYIFTNSNATASNVLNFNGAISNGTASTSTLTLGSSGGNNAGANTVAGVISNGTAGGTTAVYANAGTWVLTGSNTFSGGVTINRGTLDINSAQALGTGTFTLLNGSIFDNTSNGDITLSTNNPIAINGATNFAGTHSLNLGTGAASLGTNLTVTVSGNTLTFGGVISGAHSLAKGGAGTLVFAGANTFSGATTFATNGSGIINYQNGTAFGTNSAITVSTGNTVQVQGGIAGGTLGLSVGGTGASGATGALENVKDSNSYAGLLTLTAATTISADAGTLTLTGGITNAGYLPTFTGAGNVTVSTGAITGGGGLAMSGTGTLTLSAANTYTGTTVINSGTLSASNIVVTAGASSLGNASTVVSLGGTTTTGTLNYTGNTATFARGFSVNAGGGEIDVTTAGQVLTISTAIKNTSGGLLTIGGAGDTIISGAIGAGSGGVTKTGAGTLTLSNVETYTGVTTVSAGTLNVTGSLNASSAVSVANAATLAGTGTIGGSVTLASGATVNLVNGSTGTLTVGSLSATGDALTFEIGTSVGVSDKIAAGSLTIGAGTTTITIDNLNNLASGGQTLADGNYTLLTYGGTATGSLGNFSLSTTSLDGKTLSLSTSTSGQIILVVADGSGVTDTGTDYFNGTGTDLTQAPAYDTGLTTGTATPTAPSASSNLFFSAARNSSVTSGTVGSNLEVNSVNFGTGGTKSTFAVSGSGTITIDAAGVNGNTAGSGITIASGGGSASISNAVVLGRDESLAPADPSSTLTMSGQISGAHQLTKSGAGTVILSNASGNSYSGGTAVTSGRLLVTNTSGSGTGTGAVSLTGTTAILGGSGKISGGITLSSGGMLYSGATASAVTTGPGTGAVNGTTGGMTLSSALNVNGATLSFALSNTATSSYTSPALSTSYITTTGTVNFSGTDAVDLVDLTNGGLSLRMNQPYLLISATSGSMFTGLVIENAAGQIGLSDNGFQGVVLGVWAGGSNPYTDYTKIAINEFGSNGVTALANGTTADPGYYQPSLYLSGGDLEVVPEPGTWALMIGGLALLVVIQRRKNTLG
jgi:fibronectin-binding autotransporter adhesin